RDVRAICPPALRCFALTLLFSAAAAAGPPKLADVPLAEKLRSPRDTLQTLYYAVDVYDYVPLAILDAVACLDLGDTMPPDSASAALLAVRLENILNGLDLPLASVPDRPDGEPLTLHDADGITVVLKRGRDGLWRFDRPTV